ncbi:MAG: BrnA antitoxin family protein [Bryobacterales bacterium]|nr:BrnA antitoxin family protein [Bryobacterales bacterium]
MKDQYDFTNGKRGKVRPHELEPEGKTRITIGLDQDIVDRFFAMAGRSGGTTGYQTLINAALREYLDGKAPRFALRRIIREELKSSAA